MEYKVHLPAPIVLGILGLPVLIQAFGHTFSGSASTEEIRSRLPHSPDGDCVSCKSDTFSSAFLEVPIDPQCLDVVEVNQGGSIALSANLAGQALSSSGHLQAEFGTVDQGGVYHAPTQLPPLGMDSITVFGNMGDPLAVIHLQVKPSVGYSSSPNPTVLSVTESGGGGSTNVLEGLESSVEPEPSEVHPTIASEIYPLADLSAIQGVNRNGSLAYSLPLSPDPINGLTAPDGLEVYALGPVASGSKCGVLPRPTGACLYSMTKEIKGPWKYYDKQPIAQRSFSGTVGVAGTSISVTVSYWSNPAVRVQFIDHYVCVNGAWEFVKTTKCVMDGAKGWDFQPATVGSVNQVATGPVLGYLPPTGHRWDVATFRCFDLK